MEKDRLYQLPLKINEASVLVCLGEQVSGLIWHAPLGHLHNRTVEELVKQKVIKSSCNNFSIYESCSIGKSHNLPYKVWSTIYSSLALIFANIWGLAAICSSKGFSYYINFIDAATNYN